MKQRPSQPPELFQLSWPQIQAAEKSQVIVTVPFGAIEQHGPHLPTCTDSIIAAALATRIADRLGGYAAETVSYGTRSDPHSGGGEGYPGTVSLRPETLLGLAVDVLVGLAEDGFRRLFLLNAHYENAPLLREAARRVVVEHPAARVLFCNWWDLPPRKKIVALFPSTFPGMDLEHAGLLETSLMLHLAPSLVRTDVPLPDAGLTPRGYEVYPERRIDDASSGALAPAVGATATIGQQLVEMIVAAAAMAARREFHDG